MTGREGCRPRVSVIASIEPSLQAKGFPLTPLPLFGERSGPKTLACEDAIEISLHVFV